MGLWGFPCARRRKTIRTDSWLSLCKKQWWYFSSISLVPHPPSLGNPTPRSVSRTDIYSSDAQLLFKLQCVKPKLCREVDIVCGRQVFLLAGQQKNHRFIARHTGYWRPYGIYLNSDAVIGLQIGEFSTSWPRVLFFYILMLVSFFS